MFSTIQQLQNTVHEQGQKGQRGMLETTKLLDDSSAPLLDEHTPTDPMCMVYLQQPHLCHYLAGMMKDKRRRRRRRVVVNTTVMVSKKEGASWCSEKVMYSSTELP